MLIPKMLLSQEAESVEETGGKREAGGGKREARGERREARSRRREAKGIFKNGTSFF